jgi:hypothetical protein
MRIFKSGSSYGEIILLIIVNIILAVLLSRLDEVDRSITVILRSILAINIMAYLYLSNGMYFFEIHSNELVIKNSWRPWTELHYSMKDIDSMESKNVVRLGNILFIKLKGNRRKKGYLTSASLNDLKELVEKFDKTYR